MNPNEAARCALVVCFLAGPGAWPWAGAQETGAAGVDTKNNPLVEQAIADLARNESVPRGAIELVKFESVTWPDASLGCPRAGMRYKQVPVDGARILLRSPDGEREYHSGGGRAPFLCDNGGMQSGVPVPGGQSPHTH